MQIVAHLDLIRLAARPEAANHPDLLQAIQRASAAGSIREDLRAAAAALDLIETLVDSREMHTGLMTTGQPNISVVGALFTEAVILYDRATTTGSDRPPLVGEAKLSPEQRTVHREALRLRNSAVAHFGRGDFLNEGPLLRQAVLLTSDPDARRPETSYWRLHDPGPAQGRVRQPAGRPDRDPPT